MTYDGLDGRGLERLTGAPFVEIHASLPSTLDVAHELGARGAPSGALVLADEQTAGRGRHGRAWHSPAGAGLWLAVLLRPARAPVGGALAIRAGLAAVDAIAHAVPEVGPRLRWPNDLIAAGRKAGGILCEARWSGERLGWAAVGVGINVRGPVPVELADRAIALQDLALGLTRVVLLAALAPRIAALADRPPELEDGEREQFGAVCWVEGEGARDAATVDREGALLVRTGAGLLDRRVFPF
ncbi:MAG: biotin--[acetyl-CoA-carboxylase] ligase [Gemmatimonadetes bacterium]|nr:biotin--[acetyl-CoA-carboxylase] ligase [Gemmatimonadota bacterium]